MFFFRKFYVKFRVRRERGNLNGGVRIIFMKWKISFGKREVFKRVEEGEYRVKLWGRFTFKRNEEGEERLRGLRKVRGEEMR